MKRKDETMSEKPSVYEVLMRRMEVVRAAEAETWAAYKAQPDNLEVLHRHVRLLRRGNRLWLVANRKWNGGL